MREREEEIEGGREKSGRGGGKENERREGFQIITNSSVTNCDVLKFLLALG